MSTYTERIEHSMIRAGLGDRVDVETAEIVEALMRVEHGTLDGLTSEGFDAEVRMLAGMSRDEFELAARICEKELPAWVGREVSR